MASHPARVYIAVIILVIIALVAAAAAAARRYEHYLAGLWVGDPAFLKKAQLRDLQLFIAPRDAGGCRQGYLIITDKDGEFVSNQAIEICEHTQWWSALSSTFRVKTDAYSTSDFQTIYDDVTAGDPPMPEAMKMTLSILEGTLTLYDKEKVYAFMHKDLAASAAAIAASSE